MDLYTTDYVLDIQELRANKAKKIRGSLQLERVHVILSRREEPDYII